MRPIHELLARIRWDVEFAKSRFVIGYRDRMAGKVLHADLREITWGAENPSSFDLTDEDSIDHTIPFHRVREVWRDGALIWERHPAGDANRSSIKSKSSRKSPTEVSKLAGKK